MIEEARRHAIDRMVENATAMGANAVAMMRFDSSEIGQTMSEIVAYGTAVIVEPQRNSEVAGRDELHAADRRSRPRRRFLAMRSSRRFRGRRGFVIAGSAPSACLAIAGTIFERVRYKPVTPQPPLGPGWVETNERFRDPATDRWVQVYFKPETGERSYVEIAPPTN